ncbi:SsgA family sporulation/cell division regulator, partial [Streptomyces violaceoruber]
PRSQLLVLDNCEHVIGAAARLVETLLTRCPGLIVRVRPYAYDRTVLEFHAPEGTAVIHVRSGELRRFLQAAGELVPVGLEHLQLDLDHDLAELMRGSC